MNSIPSHLNLVYTKQKMNIQNKQINEVWR